MTVRITVFNWTAVGLCTAFFIGAVQAQTFPGKPITILSGFAAGGTTDLLARILAEDMSKRLGVPMIVENKAGATGAIAFDALQNAPRDGHTLYLLASPTLIAMKLQGKDFDADRAITALGKIYGTGFYIASNPGLPELQNVNTVADLVSAVKANPGKINYASTGVGSTGHLTGELLARMAGLQWVHVPYKSAPLATQALMAGDTSLFFGADPRGDLAQAGRLRFLASTGASRDSRMLSVPTLVESGYDVVAESWGGLIASSGLRAEVANRLASELKRSMENPAVTSKMTMVTPSYGTATDLQRMIKKDSLDWGKVIRDLGLKAE